MYVIAHRGKRNGRGSYKDKKMSLAQEIAVKLGKSLIMSGELYPADIAPVLAPNKYRNMAVFPVAWGFTHKAMHWHLQLSLQIKTIP